MEYHNDQQQQQQQQQYGTHKVSEVISRLSRHKTSWVGKPSDVLNIGIELRWIRFQHDVDESG